MKINNRSLIAALAVSGLLACFTIASAQESNNTPKPPPRGQGPGIDRQMDRLTTELSLTDDQKPKVKAVLEEGMKKRQALRDVPADERAEKGKALREEQNKKMKEILTADQFEKWQKMQSDMRQRRGGPGGPGGPGAGGPPPEKKDAANQSQ